MNKLIVRILNIKSLFYLPSNKYKTSNLSIIYRQTVYYFNDLKNVYDKKLYIRLLRRKRKVINYQSVSCLKINFDLTRRVDKYLKYIYICKKKNCWLLAYLNFLGNWLLRKSTYFLSKICVYFKSSNMKQYYIWTKLFELFYFKKQTE